MIHLFNSMNIYPGIPIPDIPAENSSPEPDAVAAVLDSRHNYERILCHGPLSGVKSIEAGGNTTLLKFIERLMQERQFIDTLNEKNNQSYNSMYALEQIISEIGVNSEEEIKISSALKQAVSDINHSIADVNRLSNQTNLPAMETAHVSAQGCGFSFIVKVIKSRASEVKQHAAQIALLSNTISARAGQVCESVSAIHALITRISQEMASTSETLEQVIERSGHMQKIIHHIAIQQFLNMVKRVHIIWKYQVCHYLFIRDRQAVMNVHHSCRLGHRYYTGEGVMI
ncbi:methyl-accepting chemotaxis protein [Edwardsiella ictaluri]|uniref:Methyl-accepting transducer domain-containing protein n=4 Tax=Edwardsiella ictaluri TaxID=67780 RepID=C5BCD0_EDWI9|nr:methyl-accepting chemotaxis protein [Edwardsiella ictaluri]ACR67493.1 hypothetical protein NT01EI_0250 [Edwardsiella ictaluri 93-146]EKS7763386.1 methyl-accepting chemotaxis protein [Edwardsiella ictaluri]EKS7770206.1 methyl-accepting chemotaxis protein [Edwardsiella ictaluri]EKS7786943.1 methyl-accepting chemotaxis protein [Edwardsiella ictaluri]EKS7796957.1 methyl-accepting chemotaxis protein [Edwardsiella ictaluri]